MLKKEPAIYYGWAVARLELWWTPERVERSKNMRKWQRLWSMLPPLRQHELEVFVYKLRGLGVTEERIGDVLHAAVKSEAQYTSDNELVNILRRRQRRKK